MRIALCQFNACIGAVSHNVDRIIEWSLKAYENGAELIIFPELSICGYPPQDILYRQELHEQIAAGLKKIASTLPIAVIVGAPIATQKQSGQPFWNAAIICEKGMVNVVCRKQLLPNYGVFDERRYFEPGTENDGSNILQFKGLKLGLSICEDAWSKAEFESEPKYENNPIRNLKNKNVDVIINMSASPFSLNKVSFREKLFTDLAKKHKCNLLMVGQVGANDGLIFDGQSMAINSSGDVINKIALFQEGLLFVDVKEQGVINAYDAPVPFAYPGQMSLLNQALVLGIKDYVAKCKSPGVILGLSGGVDSAVTAALAVQALGAEKVIGVRMPSKFSSSHSLTDAEALAKNLKIKLIDLPIESAVDAFRSILKTELSKSRNSIDIVDQNLQARTRGMLLMALSNQNQHLVLSTGNKSELAMGYATLYGDMCGALSPLGDVYKTKVWELANFINKDREIIPLNTITKPPSAELKAEQRDDDNLLPYSKLDQILEFYIERELSASQISVNLKINIEEVQNIIKVINLNDFKRRQAPVILAITSHTFGISRRWPVSKAYI
ncbi:MAG: NAD+ synthase [bacterium]|nr:NAD+ synthase [bacterium]